jgi:ABC-type multidrug transport system fused ATPase/permease subunit
MFLSQYQRYSLRFGSFWGLYLVGIASIFNLSYSIIKIVVSFCVQFIQTFYTNQLVTNKKEGESNELLQFLVIIITIRAFDNVIEYHFEKVIKSEQIKISQRIGSSINDLYLGAPFKWKLLYPNSAQKDSIRELFHTYNGMANMLSYVISRIISSFSILMVSFTNDWSIAMTIIIGTYILFKIRNYLNTELNNLDKEMGNSMDNLSIIISNQFAMRADIQYVSRFKILMEANSYDPINGCTRSCEIWDNRDILSIYSNTIINIIKSTIIIGISIYLWYIQKSELIMFILVNSDNLFGFMDVMTNLDNVKNISSGRTASSFKMIDELIKMATQSELEVVVIKDEINMVIDEIRIMNICQKINDKIILKCDNPITIHPNKKGIILLNGKKGSGKSLTMDLLAGMYDGNVADVYVNKIKLQNGFRDLFKYRGYVRQEVASDYRLNKNNTVYMTLRELFPNGSFEQIMTFLMDFEMAHKIPSTMDTPISQNERGMSPGETQSIVVASQIWKFLQLNLSFWLLDEIERNIDIDTVKRIFNKINSIYHGTIILITHSPEVKEYLGPHIKEVWNYEANEDSDGNCILSFKISSNMT